MPDLYAKLAEILDVSEVRPDDVLSAFPAWDSLSILSTIAMLDASYGVSVTAADLKALSTAGDLARETASRKNTIHAKPGF